MIDQVLLSVTEGLNEYLGSYYDMPEGMVELGVVGGNGGEGIANKMVVSLLNLEKEGAMGATHVYRSGESDKMMQGAPAWYLNVFFVVAAVFDEKRYGESLKMLSASIGFLQQNVLLVVNGKQKFTIEPVSMNIQELTNLWSILGGHYYPSVVCKIRMLTFDNHEAKRVITRIKGLEL